MTSTLTGTPQLKWPIPAGRDVLKKQGKRLFLTSTLTSIFGIPLLAEMAVLTTIANGLQKSGFDHSLSHFLTGRFINAEQVRILTLLTVLACSLGHDCITTKIPTR